MAEQNVNAMVDYHGSCHCGAFKYSVKLPKLETVVACNCSICSKKGYLWAFPSSDLFVVEKGDGTLKEYQFANKTMRHKFCPSCGTSVMAERDQATGPSGIGLNVRTLEGVDLEKLKCSPYDGAALEPAYEPPTKTEASDKDGITEYCGSCHCGKVIYKVKSEKLTEVTECNCSICSRNAYLWIYPSKDDVQIQGKEHLHCYHFATKTAGHCFCTTCGVSVLNQLAGEKGAMQPVNVRLLNGVDLAKLKIKKVNGKDAQIKP